MDYYAVVSLHDIINLFHFIRLITYPIHYLHLPLCRQQLGKIQRN